MRSRLATASLTFALAGATLLAAGCSSDDAIVGGGGSGGTATPEPEAEATDTEDEAPAPTEAPAAAPREWLPVDGELRIGDFRYVSPCQVISPAVVTEAYGELGPEAYIQQETFFQESQTRGSSVYNTRCDWYFSRLDTQQFYAEQYSSAKNLRQGFWLTETAGVDDARTRIQAYQTALAAAPDADVQALVDEMAADVETLEQISDDGPSSRLVDDAAATGLLFPESTSDYGFSLLLGNVVWRGVTRGNSEGTDGGLDGSPEEVVEGLRPTAVLVARVRELTVDPALPQTPAATVVGDTDVVGSTTVLEPCAVLTSAVFQRLTGLAENASVNRSHVVARLSTTADDDGTPIYPRNSCTRTHDEPGDGLDTTVRLALEYTGSAADADAVWVGRGNDAREVLDTAADRASLSPADGLFNAAVDFQLGDVLGNISVDSVDRSGTVQQAARRQQVAAVAAAVRGIRKSQRLTQE